MVLQRLSGLLQKAGAAVRIEPNWFDGKRPDAQVHFAHESILLDVSVIHPTAPSYFRRAAGSSLAASKRREQQKVSKYQARISVHPLCHGDLWFHWNASCAPAEGDGGDTSGAIPGRWLEELFGPCAFNNLTDGQCVRTSKWLPSG